MSLDIRQNLMKYAEETAYSSKGHFKSADWVKTSLVVYIVLPIIISIVIITFLNLQGWLSRLLGSISLISSILALASPLVSNQEQALKMINEHMALGNEYLVIHKEIRNLSTHEQITNDQIEYITEKIKLIDIRTDKIQISFMGRLWSKLKINKEMDLGWIEK